MIEKTYGCAGIAVASDLALASADSYTGVLAGLAPVVAFRLWNIRDRNRAAWDGGVEGGVLRIGKAGKGRGCDYESGVEHCEMRKVAMSARCDVSIG